ncbi:hypothetical protein BB561_005265 [Smittium simulii]|uniref:Pacifastin domain-containing protein n=1 Tax=Smittium simulii TaxID=133385 RepID=A0A2T9YBB3_9FUNG|nr:hypothetical protein BB561_005265 [Smittium simulii]
MFKQSLLFSATAILVIGSNISNPEFLNTTSDTAVQSNNLQKSNEYNECVKKYGGESFKSPNDNCNTCFCGENGAIACTLIGCIDSNSDLNNLKPINDTILIKKYKKCIQMYSKGLFPSPFSSCNTCVCKPDGLLDCSENICKKNDKIDKQNYKLCIQNYGSSNFKCPTDGCNNCRCANSGLISTRMACPKSKYDNDKLYNKCIKTYGKKIFPNTKSKCSKCRCTSTGKIACMKTKCSNNNNNSNNKYINSNNYDSNTADKYNKNTAYKY